MKYQPETTHVSGLGYQYALINNAWHYLYLDDVWVKCSMGLEWHNRNLRPIKQPTDCTDNEEVVLSGGSTNYYKVHVAKPTTLPESYDIECNDLIEALRLNPQESNILKEIFRTANERTHGNGKAGNGPKRAAEKVLFFAVRNAVLNYVDVGKIVNEINH